MPISHISLPITTTTLQEAKTFYLSILTPLNYKIFMEIENTIGFAPKYGGPDFWLHWCSDQQKEGKGEKRKGVHVCFEGSGQKQVKAFYEAALKAGAKPNGEPGFRPQYTKGYYAAFVIDPEGNNLECLYYNPWWMMALKNAPLAAVFGFGLGVAWWFGRK